MLVRFTFEQEHYSHIILIPLISVSLALLERGKIFAHAEACWNVGLALLFAGALVSWAGEMHSASLSSNDHLAIAIAPVVVIWVGAFVLCYGLRVSRLGLFPMLFLFLMIPIPDFLLNRVILWLQTGSAEVSSAVFQLVGIPVFRAGFHFSLPGLTIEVGKECSGIRSSLVTLIMSLLAGHLFLGPPGRRLS